MEGYNTTHNYKGDLLPTSKCPSSEGVSTAIGNIVLWNAHQKGDLPRPISIYNSGCNPKVIIGRPQDRDNHTVVNQRDFNTQEAAIYLGGSSLLYALDAEIRHLEKIRREILTKGVK